MAQVLQAHAVLLSLKNFFVLINTKLHSKSCNLLPILKKSKKRRGNRSLIGQEIKGHYLLNVLKV